MIRRSAFKAIAGVAGALVLGLVPKKKDEKLSSRGMKRLWSKMVEGQKRKEETDEQICEYGIFPIGEWAQMHYEIAINNGCTVKILGSTDGIHWGELPTKKTDKCITGTILPQTHIQSIRLAFNGGGLT